MDLVLFLSLLLKLIITFLTIVVKINSILYSYLMIKI